MSEFATENHRPDAAERPGETPLTASVVEALLSDFRAWFEAVGEIPPPPSNPLGEPLNLAALLGQMTALKQEVNLNTRATRAALEQNEQVIRDLTQAQENLQTAYDELRSERESAADTANKDRLWPILRGIMEVADALYTALREVEKQSKALDSLLETLRMPSLPELPEPLAEAPPLRLAPIVVAPASPRSLWAKLFGGARPEPITPDSLIAAWQALESERANLASARAALAAWRLNAGEKLTAAEEPMRATGKRVRLMLDGLLTGYRMSLNRLQRFWGSVGVEPLNAVGKPFDPETMEVLDTLPETGRPDNEVIEEVRRGYRWDGRLVRHALVRVARSSNVVGDSAQASTG